MSEQTRALTCIPCFVHCPYCDPPCPACALRIAVLTYGRQAYCAWCGVSFDLVAVSLDTAGVRVTQ
jgi:hypothetical protein